MAQITKHVFISAKADGADTARVRPLSNWNDGHVFSGGANGNLLMRDTGDATYGGDWAAGLVWDNTNKLLQVTENLAGTVAVDVLYLTKNTTGTPANNMGPGVLFRGESSTTIDQNMAAIRALWSDVTHATRSAYLSLLTVNGAGALTERVRISAAGDLGVGIAAPDSLVHVWTASAGAVTAVSGTVLTVEGGGSTFISILTPAASTGVLTFGSPTSNRRGEIAYNHATDTLVLRAQGTTDRVTIGTGVQVGVPTGGDKGAGTLNAVAVYDDNVLLTDYLWDLYYDGALRPEDQVQWSGARLWSLAETRIFTHAHRHLPTLPGRAEWAASGARSLGQMVTALWETVEQQQMHLFALEAELAALCGRN